jgi:hypothetical protein
MHDFVDYVVRKLVDKPDSVQLTQEEKEANKVVFQLKVDPEDVGKFRFRLTDPLRRDSICRIPIGKGKTCR